MFVSPEHCLHHLGHNRGSQLGVGCMGTCGCCFKPPHLGQVGMLSSTGRGGLWEQQGKAWGWTPIVPVVGVRGLGWNLQMVFFMWRVFRGTEVSVGLHLGLNFPFVEQGIIV